MDFRYFAREMAERDYTVPFFTQQLYNYCLVNRYPWLQYYGDYENTVLDMMPDGWRKKFGFEMCESIQRIYEILPKEEQTAFELTSIKIEEDGSLAMYFTQEYDERLVAALEKYIELSRNMCQECGEPVTYETKEGRWCKDHAPFGAVKITK